MTGLSVPTERAVRPSSSFDRPRRLCYTFGFLAKR